MKSPWSIERFWNSCTLIKVLTKKDWNKKKFWLSLGLITFELLILNWTDCPNLFLRLVQVITHLIPQRLQVLSHYLSFYLKFSMKIVISSIVRRPCSFSSRFKTCNFRPVFFKMIKKKKKRFNRSRSAIFGEFFCQELRRFNNWSIDDTYNLYSAVVQYLMLKPYSRNDKGDLLLNTDA